MNEKMKPYVEWLEGLIENLIEHQPEKIGVCAILPDGNILTGYYGDCCPKDKAEMGFHMNNDGVLDTVFANAREIVRAAEEDDSEDA
jgi:hypothetical protein